MMSIPAIETVTILRKAAGADVQLDRSDNDGFLWVRVNREHDGRPVSFSKRVDLDHTESDAQKIAEDIKQWWDEVRE